MQMRSVTQKQGRRAPGKSANKMPAWGKCAAASARQPAAAAQTARGPSPPHEGSTYHPSELDTKCSWPGAVLQKRRKLGGAAGESAAGNPSGAGPGRDWTAARGGGAGRGRSRKRPASKPTGSARALLRPARRMPSRGELGRGNVIHGTKTFYTRSGFPQCPWGRRRG